MRQFHQFSMVPANSSSSGSQTVTGMPGSITANRSQRPPSLAVLHRHHRCNRKASTASSSIGFKNRALYRPHSIPSLESSPPFSPFHHASGGDDGELKGAKLFPLSEGDGAILSFGQSALP